MQDTGKKFLLCLLPFLNGIAFKAYQLSDRAGLSTSWFSFPGFVFSVSSLLFAGLFYYLFAESFRSNVKQPAYFFGFKLPQISPWIIIAPFFASILMLPFSYEFMGSNFVQGFLRTIIIGVIIEEVLARAIFIKYPQMPGKEFVIWGILSNCSFSLNHWLYDMGYLELGLIEQLQKFSMHFFFGLMLSGIVYRSKKLNITIFAHSWSNFQVYLYRASALAGELSTMAFYTLLFLLLTGLDTKEEK